MIDNDEGQEVANKVMNLKQKVYVRNRSRVEDDIDETPVDEDNNNTNIEDNYNTNVSLKTTKSQKQEKLFSKLYEENEALKKKQANQLALKKEIGRDYEQLHFKYKQSTRDITNLKEKYFFL